MRFFVGFLTVALVATLVAQTTTYENVASVKDIMTTMASPASNALFGAQEKPTDQEWAELRKNALILAEAGNLLMIPGRMTNSQTKSKGKTKDSSLNPAAWNDAAKSMRSAAKLALGAVDKKDPDLLAGDVAEKILASCSSCHDKYMAK